MSIILPFLTSDQIYDLSEEARRDYDYESDMELKRQGVGLEPEHPQVHLNYGLSLLRLGFFDEGWGEYAWLHKNPPETGDQPPDGENTHGLVLPEWGGQTLKNKTLLLVCEEGLGDFIQFLRFALDLKADRRMRTKLLVLAPPPLAAIFSRSPLVDRVLSGGEMIATDEYDYWIATCQLPDMMHAGAPRAVPPYLFSDPVNNSRWGTILHRRILRPHQPTVALVWGGNPKHSNDAFRSLPFADLQSLFTLSHINFVSLQMDDRRHEARELLVSDNYTDLGSCVETFDDTASILSHCDLLLTVDSAPCHLAGALGVETWVLIPDLPDWRWGPSGDTNIWYDNMRVFRQPAYGTWVDAVHEVCVAMQERFPQTKLLGSKYEG